MWDHDRSPAAGFVQSGIRRLATFRGKSRRMEVGGVLASNAGTMQAVTFRSDGHGSSWNSSTSAPNAFTVEIVTAEDIPANRLLLSSIDLWSPTETL